MKLEDVDKLHHELAGSFATIKMLASMLVKEHQDDPEVLRLARLITKICEHNISTLMDTSRRN